MTVMASETQLPTPRGTTARRLAILDSMVERAALPLQVPRPEVIRALALTIAKHPPGSPHAALVGRALTASRGPEQDRPIDEQAVRRLVSRGHPAYARAVQAAIQELEAAAAARPARLARLTERCRPIAERDGPAAAQAVADSWARYSVPPTPTQLAWRLGWSTRDARGVVHHLVEQGWLRRGTHGRLHPGPRYQDPAG